MPRLPRLPPLSEWKSIWNRATLRYSMDQTNRQFRGRALLANPKLTNEFVRALKIREGEVVIEAFPGPGQLTRSLLYGGNDLEADTDKGEGVVKKSKKYPEPKLVVAVEPSPEMLVSGLGMSPDDKPSNIPSQFISEDYTAPDPKVVKTDEPRLLVSPSTPYRWPTLPQMLSHELVTPHLPVSNYENPNGTGTMESTRRSWKAPPPHITLVSQMPDSVAGDQLIAQWIGSVVGTEEGDEKSWIWRWGRVRLALLVSKGQYDRLMAGPREKIFCKLSVMARAMFHITPLPPYHHVHNVDKSSRHTESRPIIPITLSESGSVSVVKSRQNAIPPPPDPNPITTTYPDDFYPVPVGHAKHLDVPLPRPLLLGLMLEPKLNSPVNLDNKDEWDYVLRKCFVTEAQSIKASLKNLAFGAEILMDRISEPAEESKYAGKPVSPDRVIRDLDVEEWTRVVDCFHKWAFKPYNLLLDTKPDLEVRQFGIDY